MRSGRYAGERLHLSDLYAAAGTYNGNLVIWAHGFQDAGVPVGIPEDQLCFGGVCFPTSSPALGFGFATNSYSKTGLAILQGKDDVLDLVKIFAAPKGTPKRSTW